MELDALVKLIGSGNISTVEEYWLGLLEEAELPIQTLVSCKDVLAEMRKQERIKQAEVLAATTIEALLGRTSPAVALEVAGPYLLAIGESKDLRGQVTELYRQTFADREGLEELLTEAGLLVGRPVRRALRTLEVCLAIHEGHYLTARDQDIAARVDQVDIPAWRYTIQTAKGDESLGAVTLADAWQPAQPDDFLVLRQFDATGLTQRLQDDPAAIVIDLCRRRDNKLDSDALEAMLVPDVLSRDAWKKWWTKARADLKRHPGVEIEGRSPYFLHYVETPLSPEERLLSDLRRQGDPKARFNLVLQYVRDSEASNKKPELKTLQRCTEMMIAEARRLEGINKARAGVVWLMARVLSAQADVQGAAEAVVKLLKATDDPGAVLAEVDHDQLIDPALASLEEARPDTWQADLLSAFPRLWMNLCDRAAARLMQAGATVADFESAVQQTLASPTDCFECLLWLWDAPSEPAQQLRETTTPTTLLSRILRALDQSRRGEGVDREAERKISLRARIVLAARKYERFVQCMESIEPGMATAFRTQLVKQDGLGRAVREDLVNLLDDYFPPATPERDRSPLWARKDMLFVTERGLARRQSEVEHHVNVKMRENARAIGAAAEKGDLSENSEYKFALEERDLLQARLMQMNAELSQARVLNADDVARDHIGIGSRVVFERLSDGERYEMSFLGPWEADAEKNIFNYQSPLAQLLMGKKLGEVVTFEHRGATGEYCIKELHNALTGE